MFKRRPAVTAPALLFDHCRSLHTFGMRFDLDIMLVSSTDVVLMSCRSVPPNRLLVSEHAAYAIERPASDLPWPQVGAKIMLVAGGIDKPASATRISRVIKQKPDPGASPT